MNKFKKALIDLLICLKKDFRFDEKYKKEIAYLEQVLKYDKYIFMPVEKLNSATFTTEDLTFDKRALKRKLRLTFTSEFTTLKPEFFCADENLEDFWKQVDEYLFNMLKEGLEQDI